MKLQNLVNKTEPYIYEVFKHLHENPELSMQEYETSSFIEEQLRTKCNVDSIKQVGETGLLVEIKGSKPGKLKTIALRGDMDALPIEESKEFKLKSKNPGVMHACGHDVHTSILLGAVKVLESYKHEISGSILFFFQQGEEVMEGAKLFLKSPYIDFNNIDGAVACHVSPEMDAGVIGLRYGGMLASTDDIRINVKGKTGHAAHPHTVVDTIVIASQIINNIQILVSREVDPNEAAVISLCTIEGGVKNNIVPDNVEITGTLRAISPVVREYLLERIVEISKGIAYALRGSVEVDIKNGPPPLINNKEWAKRAFSIGSKLLGKENVIEMDKPSMGAEDFSFIMEKVPGVFIRLGARTPKGPYGSMHSSTFYSDRGALKTGILTLAGIALDFMDVEI